MATDFASLDRYGLAAMANATPDNMGRLEHLTVLMGDQGEYEAAIQWNARLRQMALQSGDDVYLGVVEVNDATIRQQRDKSVTMADADRLVAKYAGTMAGFRAKILKARLLIDNQQAPAALALLRDAYRDLPVDRHGDRGIEVRLLSYIGLAHSQLHDVSGYLKAMKRAEGAMQASGYPWPDYEAVYNLSLTLAFVGRYDEAYQVMRVYQSLAEHTGTPMRRAMAGGLCGYVAVTRDDWPAVLACYAPFGPALDVPASLAPSMLPRRAVGYARTGQLALARKDIREIRRRIDASEMPFTPAVHRAEAEVLLASGDYRQGIKALRDYHLSQYRRATQRSAQVMEDVVVDIDEQLQQAQRQNELRARTIATQWWLIGAITVLIAGLILLLLRQRRMSQALEKAHAREREENARRAQFFADVSHEIRTPLNGVVAMADALRKEDLPHDVAEKVRLIATSSEMLDRLLSDVLDNAKMEAGELTIETQPFDLAQLVRDVVALWRSKAETHDLKLSLQTDLGDSYWVKGDDVRLGEVLNNLLSNALKFTPQGRILLSVVRMPDEQCLFVVTDTGIGFDAGSNGHIFERYRQADGTISNRFGGTGLGLSISSNLVKMMGGRLNAASKPGEGAQFWFSLPLPQTHDRSVELPASDAGHAKERVADTQALRVLIVDDNTINQNIVGILLNGDEYQLTYAANGLEALEAASKGGFDVILMDVQMPVMDGLEAVRRIRMAEQAKGASPAAIVVCSANDNAEDRKRAIEAGADGYVAKPIVLEQLLGAMHSAMQIRARQGPNAGIDIMDIALD
ncbi:ATP-binding protein [Brevundimonas sp.]|uniref:ATP-binding protein n=1 Tax=Brevundimonas sp. TaxID=1871086 RepID=UPI002FCBEAD9